MDNHASAAQRAILLVHLQKFGSATTAEIRHGLDIMMPAARIHELRHRHNHNIATYWDIDDNPGGTKQRMARYVLKDGKFTGDRK
jgi:hypothetical protein